MLRTLSVKGGARRYRETQVILPMRRSIAEVRSTDSTPMVDFSALICTMNKKSKFRSIITRIVNRVMVFH